MDGTFAIPLFDDFRQAVSLGLPTEARKAAEIFFANIGTEVSDPRARGLQAESQLIFHSWIVSTEDSQETTSENRCVADDAS